MTTSTPTDLDLLRMMLTIRIAEERMLDLRKWVYRRTPPMPSR